jgi:hypothetical protein
MKHALLIVFTLLCFSSSAFAFDVKTDIGNININGTLSGYSILTDNANPSGSFDTNGEDKHVRYDISNALVNVSKTTGVVRFNVFGGAYAFPTVGMPGNKTITDDANTGLFGPLPIAYVELDPASFLSIQAGKLPTLIGYESAFTYQNINIQRGLVWNMEPVISRGIRAIVTAGPLTLKAGANDGFYSKDKLALEGSIGLTLGNFSTSFNVLIPNKNTPANDTAAVANKQEYDLIGSYTIGKLTLGSDLLYVYSPKSSQSDFSDSAAAYGLAGFADYNINDKFSVGARLEYASNKSTNNPNSANADLVGYGPRSKAFSLTITPMYKYKYLFVRADLSYVRINNFAEGSGFGVNGNKVNQYRLGLEGGIIF